MKLKLVFAAVFTLVASTMTIAAFAQEYAVPKSAHLGVNLEGAEASIHTSVSVTLRDSPVKNLTKDDFIILEDGVPRQVTNVTTTQPVINTAIILDCSASMYDSRGELKTAVKNFILADQSRPQDRFAVICAAEHDQQFVLSPLTNNREQLNLSIDNYLAFGGTYIAEAISRVTGFIQAKSVNEISQILVFSDGHDVTSQAELAQTIKSSAKSATIINVVGIQSGFTTSKDTKYLRSLAEQTGGIYVAEEGHGLDGALKAMIANYMQRYIVAFQPIGPLTANGQHHLQIMISGHPEYAVSYQHALIKAAAVTKVNIPSLPPLRNSEVVNQEANGVSLCGGFSWAWELGVNVKLRYKGPTLQLAGNESRTWAELPSTEKAAFGFTDSRFFVGTCYIENQSTSAVIVGPGATFYTNGNRARSESNDASASQPYEVSVVQLARESYGDINVDFQPDLTLRCQGSERNFGGKPIRFREVLPLLQRYFDIDISQRVYHPECGGGTAGDAGGHS